MATHFMPGKYRARITDQGFSISKKENPVFFLELQVLATVAKDGTSTACEPLRRTYRKAITEKTVSWLRHDLKALDVEPASFAQLDPQEPGAIKLIGREIDVWCRHEPYQDELTERWELCPPRPRAGGDDVRRLDESLGHLLKKGAKPPATDAAAGSAP
jgi:hypothetical protein